MSTACIIEMTARIGFCKAVQKLLRVAEDGLCTLGVPCSSYIYMNLATSRRTVDNPYGAYLEHAYIEIANQFLGAPVVK